jgi:hypothetical protein
MKTKFLLLVLSTFLLGVNIVNATETEPNNTPAQANILPLNGSNSGAINPAGDVDWFKVTTTSDGLLTITLSNFGPGGTPWVNGYLFDNNGVTQLNGGTATNTTALTLSTDGLAAGTYYVEVVAYASGQTPNYSISDTLITAPVNNDSEPDSSRATALPLALDGSTAGHIGYYYNLHRDSADEYMVTTNADGLLRVTLTDNTPSNENFYVSMTVYDNDGVIVIYSTNHAAYNNPLVASIDGLAAGTYYIRITPYNSNQFAPYTLADSLFSPAQANDIGPDSTRATALTLPLNGSKTGHIGYYYNNHRDSADEYKVTTTADGLLRVTLTDNTPINENFYVNMTVYDNDGVTVINSTNHAAYNNPLVASIDGLAAGTYYIQITPYNSNQFAPYTLADSLFSPAQANDIEPDSTRATALTLPLNGSKTGHIGYYYNNHRDSADEYKVITTADGLLRVTLTDNTPSNENFYVNMTVYDNDGVTVIYGTNHATYGGPLVANIDGLAAGTYYIKISAYSANQFAPYTLADSLFSPAQANDIEPDSTKATALTLPLNGSTTGHIGYYYNLHRDSADEYKVTTTADGLLRVTLTDNTPSNENFYVNMTVYDNDGVTVIYSINHASYNNPFVANIDGLAAGTYYIKITPYTANQFAPYTLADSLFLPAQANDAEPNNSVAQAETLPLNATVTGHIGYYYNNQRDSSDWYAVTTNQDGMLQMILTNNTPSSENYYVNMTVYDHDGVTVLFSTNHAAYNSPLTENVDGIAAGTYYVKITQYSTNQFAPYTLKDTLYTYNANDPEPNNSAYQASTIPANSTVTGHLDFYYNGARDNPDWWKINYTGNAGTINMNVTLSLAKSNGSLYYVNLFVYKDTTASPIYSSTLSSTSNNFTLSGLTEGYYWIKLSIYSAGQFNAYAITDSFIQVDIAKINVSTFDSAGSCSSTNTITYKCSKSHSPYTVQLYRFGIPYGSAIIANSAGKAVFSNLPDGAYNATVYGDGGTGPAVKKSVITSIIPRPTGTNTTNITVTQAKANWTIVSCAKFYSVQYRPVDSATWITKKTAGNVGTYTIKGLDTATSYYWKVAAVDSANRALATSANTDSLLFTTASGLALIAGNTGDGSNELKAGNNDLNGDVFVYPNPASSQLHIQLGARLKNSAGISFALKDVNGKELWNSMNNKSIAGDISIDVRNFSPGIYFLQTFTNDRTITKKIVVEK